MAGADDGQIHVITTCEDQPQRVGCPSVVTHADGAVVSSQSPARPGETVVVHAWGLGYTTPVVKTGDSTPPTAPRVRVPIEVAFNFGPNAPPSRDFSFLVTATGYLTPGEVGLYQVNIQLPSAFPAVPSCGQDGARSNLTISLGGRTSSDGAAICVQAAQ